MASREQFEAWFVVCIAGGPVNFPEFDGDGYAGGDLYDDRFYLILQSMWMAWQASREAIEIELPEPCSPGDFCVDIPAQAHHEVVEAIEQAGLKVKK